MTLLATAALAAAVLFRWSHDYRLSLSVIVCLAALTLVVRSLSTGKLVLALIFLGIFTPFRSGQFSTAVVSVLDLATLALFAASPMMLRQSRVPAISSSTQGSCDQSAVR
jgi:hypothetical protein